MESILRRHIIWYFVFLLIIDLSVSHAILHQHTRNSPCNLHGGVARQDDMPGVGHGLTKSGHRLMITSLPHGTGASSRVGNHYGHTRQAVTMLHRKGDVGKLIHHFLPKVFRSNRVGIGNPKSTIKRVIDRVINSEKINYASHIDKLPMSTNQNERNSLLSKGQYRNVNSFNTREKYPANLTLKKIESAGKSSNNRVSGKDLLRQYRLDDYQSRPRGILSSNSHMSRDRSFVEVDEKSLVADKSQYGRKIYSNDASYPSDASHRIINKHASDASHRFMNKYPSDASHRFINKHASDASHRIVNKYPSDASHRFINKHASVNPRYLPEALRSRHLPLVYSETQDEGISSIYSPERTFLRTDSLGSQYTMNGIHSHHENKNMFADVLASALNAHQISNTVDNVDYHPAIYDDGSNIGHTVTGLATARRATLPDRVALLQPKSYRSGDGTLDFLHLDHARKPSGNSVGLLDKHVLPRTIIDQPAIPKYRPDDYTRWVNTHHVEMKRYGAGSPIVSQDLYVRHPDPFKEERTCGPSHAYHNFCVGKYAALYGHASRTCYIQCDGLGNTFVRPCSARTTWLGGPGPAYYNMCQ